MSTNPLVANEVVTSPEEVAFVSETTPNPTDLPLAALLPPRPAVLAPWVLALISSVRPAPTTTLYAAVQRVPPASRVRIGPRGVDIVPNITAEAELASRTHSAADVAIHEAIAHLPDDCQLVDTATLASAALRGAAIATGKAFPTIEPGDDFSPEAPRVATDAAGLPLLPGRSRSLRAVSLNNHTPIAVPDGLQALFALGREELADLLETVPKRERSGVEAPYSHTRRSIAERLWKRADEDSSHDHVATGREVVLLPPWLTGEAQAMVHTAALASNGGWANWFDGVDPRTGRVFWTVTDPEADHLLLAENVIVPSRHRQVLAAALTPDPRHRALVEGGRIIDHAPPRTLARGRYVIDEEARTRRAAAHWVYQHLADIPTRLDGGWLSGHGWIDFDGLADTLSNTYSRIELALPLARTVALDSWLTALDPEVA